jgi:hypothetical protein
MVIFEGKREKRRDAIEHGIEHKREIGTGQPSFPGPERERWKTVRLSIMRDTSVCE